MKPLILALVTVMLELTSRHSEPLPQKTERLTELATEMVTVTQDTRELSFAVTQAHFESRLSARIGALKCRSNECDVSKSGDHRARGYWQAWRIEGDHGWADLWDSIDGPDGVRSMVVLQFAMQEKIRCGGDVRKRFFAFSGRGCRRSAWADKRAAFMTGVEADIRRELARLEAE